MVACDGEKVVAAGSLHGGCVWQCKKEMAGGECPAIIEGKDLNIRIVLQFGDYLFCGSTCTRGGCEIYFVVEP